VYVKIAIIGAGAAGLMCACVLPVEYSVVVFDKNEMAGKKLLITGKGRCNLTNLVEPDVFLQSVPQNAKFLSSALNMFAPKDTIEFFESIGIKTQIENNSRVFPNNGGATAIKQSLENFAISRGVEFRFGFDVKEIIKTETGFTVANNIDTRYNFDAVIIATGGVSFSTTGSSGDGYNFATKFGQGIISPRPALCGLQFQHPSGFQGQTIACGVEIVDGNGTSKTRKVIGDMLFTKNGVSGPIIYKAVSEFKQHSIQDHILQIDFVPNLHNGLEVKMSNYLKENAHKKPFYVFRKFVPIAIANWLVEVSGLSHVKVCANLTKSERLQLISTIIQACIRIKDFEDIETATITRGGVDVGDINPKTMESELMPNLYFIGEVLDVDGLSGGFNLQIAFSTAVACAEALKEKAPLG